MTAKNIQKIINKKNSTWGILKLIRKEELFFSLSLSLPHDSRENLNTQKWVHKLMTLEDKTSPKTTKFQYI